MGSHSITQNSGGQLNQSTKRNLSDVFKLSNTSNGSSSLFSVRETAAKT
ncbi:hypothetical protein SynBIOSE41_02507 [Synechococcus sp. BIOS-E4-1]|nr:hypothetical protein SynBIOSE41_02507 [Synechococcus sp. BIOS-E4-1]